MENLGTYFFVALVIGFAIYLTQKKKKVAHPTADEQRVFNSKAPSSPKLNKTPIKKANSPTRTTTDLSQSTNSTATNQLENLPKVDGPELQAAQSIETPINQTAKGQEPSQAPIPPIAPAHFDLEKEVALLMARTGWDYATAKSYCESSLDYHKKVSAGTTLKK